MSQRIGFLLVLSTLAGIGIWKAFTPESGNIEADADTRFAIADTARVTRIRIADTDGRVATLERNHGHPLGLWTLNGGHFARKDATDLLLKTFLRTTVRQPVRPAAKEGVIKLIASAGKRVDIHLDGSDTPAKTWYVGTPTQSHTGTHMLLEVPGKRRFEDPYVTHIEGFTGFLSTRFFTDENEWRYTGVYESGAEDILSISGRPLDDKGRAAVITWSEDGETLTARGDYVEMDIPQVELRDHWVRMCDVHIETWDSHLAPAQEDSLRASLPAWELEVRYRDGRIQPMTLHWKAPIIEEFDEQGQLMDHDGSRMYAVVNGEVALVQTFVFNPILDFWRALENGSPTP